ncbi:MAG: roadblock/LC7 domain-containing protein [Archaeoglobus sp.]|nr:roadblock/LC7 domain-containing protein [Archaeoglobus sp.]
MMIRMYENVIADLMSVDGIRAVVISDNEGNIIESESGFLEDKDLESFTAFITDFFNKGVKAISKTSEDEVLSILIECKNEKILVCRASDSLILLLNADISANIGMMRIESKKAIEKIRLMEG